MKKRSALPPRRARGGFTLMEVLLVLAILGVIMAMVVPMLSGRRKQANIDATKLSIKSLESTLDFFAGDHDGEFPPTNPGLQALIVQPQNDAQWRGPYLKETTNLPRDAWGNPFQYESPGRHNTHKPDIWSVGADKTPNTADDITNWQVGA